jgi:hypothetical protein
MNGGTSQSARVLASVAADPFPDDYAPDSDGNQRWCEADLSDAHYRANKARLDAEDAARKEQRV